MKRFPILILLLTMLTGCAAPIVTVEGPEWDTIMIDGIEYIKAPHEYDIYSSADKDDHIGIIKSGDKTLDVYTIQSRITCMCVGNGKAIFSSGRTM